MKTLLIIISAFCTIITNGRLIEKNTEKTVETKPTEPFRPVRISRQAFIEESVISREDITQEDLKPYVRKGRYSVKSKPSSTRATKSFKDSSEIAVTPKRAEIKVNTNTAQQLIKKPIPKFNEVEYEDFQGKVDKLPVKIADSGEHEDEDFNLDDYEFDVNHDEFAGRGKPLEPRTRVKETRKSKDKKKSKPKATSPEVKMQSKVLITTHSPNIQKRNVVTKKAADKMKEDYYDDVTTTKVPETETKRVLDDDDTDESKEFDRQPPARVVRSPWLVEFLAKKMGEKTATMTHNLMNKLRPPAHYYPESEFDGNEAMMKDPLTGRIFMF